MDLSKPIEIALYSGIVQGVFLAFFLPKLAKSNREANKILALLLLLAAIATFLFLNIVYLSQWTIHSHAFLDTIPFLFAPALYFYTGKFLFHSFKPKNILLHFLPAICHLLYALSLFRYTEEEFTRLAGEGELIGQWGFVFSVLVLLLFVYWLASVQLLIKFRQEKEKILSYHQNVTFLATFLGAAFISYLVGILFSLHYFFGIELFSFTGMNLGWIILPILTYSISWFALIQPDAMRVSYNEKKKAVSRMQDETLGEYKIRLDVVMQQEKLYLNPLLKLNEVAEKVQLDTTRLSWLINEGYGCNFYDFVNRYRINAFIQKIKNNEHKHRTLLALAYETGFNSKTTFNKSFKNCLKLTPSDYVKKMNSTEHFSLSMESKASQYTLRSQNSKSESTSI